MNHALRIFRKDVRHLWPAIFVEWALIIAHAAMDIRTRPLVHAYESFDSVSYLLKMLLPLSIWFLIAQVIFQDALPGERQFWLTRPYDWKNLLAAKVLFAAAFISVPLLLSDCCILAVQGLPVFGDFQELLVRHLIVAALFILPSFVIAVVTTGLAQFLLAWFLFLVAFVSAGLLQAAASHNPGMIAVGGRTPLVFAVAVIGMCGVVIWQYAQRRTAASRLVLLAVFCALLPLGSHSTLGNVSPASQALDSRNSPDIRVEYDAGHRVTSGKGEQSAPQGYLHVRIPLTVTGLPADTILRGTANTTIEAAGKHWPESGGFYGGSVDKIGDEYRQTMLLKTSEFKELRQFAASFHASYNLEILKEERESTIPVTTPAFSVPEIGTCRSDLDVPQFQLTCRAGLTPRPEMVVLLEPPSVSHELPISFPQYSLPWGLSPTSDLDITPFPVEDKNAKLVFVKRRKIAGLRRTISIRDMHVADFVQAQ